jgi:hypothetical protein
MTKEIPVQSRAEGAILIENIVAVTKTSTAVYLYYRVGNRCLSIRIPRDFENITANLHVQD